MPHLGSHRARRPDRRESLVVVLSDLLHVRGVVEEVEEGRQSFSSVAVSMFRLPGRLSGPQQRE